MLRRPGPFHIRAMSSSLESFKPADPEFAARIRDSFARQGAMALIGARLARIEPGLAEIELPYSTQITQQHGFVHAGIVSTALDSACGYAAASLMPADSGILTIEFKINLLAPAAGERFRFLGRVRKPGRTIVVAEGEAFGIDATGAEKTIATMTATVMTIVGRAGVKG